MTGLGSLGTPLGPVCGKRDEDAKPLECGVEPFRANTPLSMADHLSLTAGRDSALAGVCVPFYAQARSKAASAPPHSKGCRVFQNCIGFRQSATSGKLRR